FTNYRGKVYKVDFANLEDGEMNESNVVFISKAYKKDGVLNVTLRRPVDSNGIEIPQEDFSTDEYEEVEIVWKTKQEIEEEKNRPKEPTEQERIDALEEALLLLMMEV